MIRLKGGKGNGGLGPKFYENLLSSSDFNFSKGFNSSFDSNAEADFLLSNLHSHSSSNNTLLNMKFDGWIGQNPLINFPNEDHNYQLDSSHEMLIKYINNMEVGNSIEEYKFLDYILSEKMKSERQEMPLETGKEEVFQDHFSRVNLNALFKSHPHSTTTTNNNNNGTTTRKDEGHDKKRLKSHQAQNANSTGGGKKNDLEYVNSRLNSLSFSPNTTTTTTSSSNGLKENFRDYLKDQELYNHYFNGSNNGATYYNKDKGNGDSEDKEGSNYILQGTGTIMKIIEANQLWLKHTSADQVPIRLKKHFTKNDNFVILLKKQLVVVEYLIYGNFTILVTCICPLLVTCFFNH